MSGFLSRIASYAVCLYVRHCPIEKGKWRILKLASSFLVVRLEPKTYIRASACSVDPVEGAIVRSGILEPDDVRTFLSLLRPGMTVFDVGANLGMYSLLCARRVGAMGSVHAFEPTPEAVARLRQNVKLNGLANVTVNQCAVCSENGSITLFVQSGSDRNTVASGSGSPIPVPAISLDTYVKEHGIGRVDAMKIDIEGAEVEALRGGMATLSADDAPFLMIECNSHTLRAAGTSPDALFHMLATYGYTCYRMQTYGSGADVYENVLAVKPTHSHCLRLLQQPIESATDSLKAGNRSEMASEPDATAPSPQAMLSTLIPAMHCESKE